MERKKKSVTVVTIRRIPGKINDNTGKWNSGSVLINEGKPTQTWINGGAWDSNVDGAGIPRETPPIAFVGCRIYWDEAVITQEMLDAAGGVITEEVRPGNVVTYKRPQVNQQNVIIDFSTMSVDDRTVNLAKLGMMRTDVARVTAPPRATTAARQPSDDNGDMIDETLEPPTGNENAGNADTAAGEPGGLEAGAPAHTDIKEPEDAIVVE